VDVPVGSDGLVAASVKLGTKVGRTTVRLTILSSAVVDSAEYDVLAGAAFRLTLAPRDTLVLTLKSFAVRAATVDRFGNSRADAVTLSSLGPEATLVGGTIVAAQSGIGTVVGQVGQAKDTVRIFVVPGAVIAGTTAFEAVLFRADGEVVKRIPFAFVSTPFTAAWSPDGTLLVLDASAAGPLRVIRPDGSITPVGAPTGLSIYPRFSPDGQWIYYSREAWEIRRIHPDGSGDEFVYAGVLADAVAPSISPDGTRMAWTGALGDVLSVRDLASGMNTAIGVGHTSVWRPQGDQLAFIDTGDESVGTARPDGTGRRRVSQASFRYYLGVDWSADGVWLIAKSRSFEPNTPMHLIHFATGTTIVLPFTDQWNAPAWSH
jgi:Tol biopolymer transport system component